MRNLAALLLVASLCACASFDAPKPLTGADIVYLAKGGTSAAQIIEELRRTGTVLPLQASDIVSLHESGVPGEVLDYLQRAQIDEIRWRDRYSQGYWGTAGFYRGFGPCPVPPSRFRRADPWGC